MQRTVNDYDVFVSFTGRDRAFAVELDAQLRKLGIRPFLDQRGLPAGLPWIVGLERAIERSRAVAILVGAHGLGNVQQYERDLALVRQSREPTFRIVPVLIPGCEALPTGFLALWTWLDLRGGFEHQGAVDYLRAAFGKNDGGPAPRLEAVCPFMGLEPFREEDSALFCGREKAILDLCARVSEHSLVAVVGRSGSGKSSLVFAGLLPELRKQRPAVVWDVLSVRPGPWPLRALAAAFKAGPEPADPVEWVQTMDAAARSLRDGDADVLAGIICRWLDLVPGKADKLLLYIDQWEELYSMAPSEDGEAKKRHAADVARFIALLLAVASDPRARTCVVLTVRADFYGFLMSHPELGALMPRQQVNIGSMSRDDLRAAIVTPARKAGLSFDPPSLVDDILDDAGTDEAVLPLLQYALKETWTHLRDGSVLTAEGYTKAGRVLGAIQTTADRTYKALDEREKAVARRLFLGLVTPGEAARTPAH